MPVASKWKQIVLGVVFMLSVIVLASSFKSPPHEQAVFKTKQHHQSFTTCAQDPIACQGFNVMAVANAAAQQELDRINAYLTALETTRLEQQKSSSTARASSGRSTSAASLPSECAGKVIPESIIWRESHCNYESVNWTGCGGSGCYGMYQIAGSHWNGGSCSDLNWESPADQDECARRLSSDGTNLRPWGG